MEFLPAPLNYTQNCVRKKSLPFHCFELAPGYVDLAGLELDL